jgi:predicted DNA-binding transcriptional regulator AlpA
MTTQSSAMGAVSPTPELLDLRAVSRMTTISPRHLRRMADAGMMPRPVRIGRLLRFRRSTGDAMTGIAEWITAGCPRCRQPGKRGA